MGGYSLSLELKFISSSEVETIKPYSVSLTAKQVKYISQASWKTPATKHVRYTITNQNNAKNLYENSTSNGSFLYL